MKKSFFQSGYDFSRKSAEAGYSRKSTAQVPAGCCRRTTVSAALFLILLLLSTGLGAQPAMPMPVDFRESASWRWLNKEVLESRLLDNMESLSTWLFETTGEASGEMQLSAEHCRDGEHAIRLTAATKGEKPGSVTGRPFGQAAAVRKVDGEDWSPYNRISFWVYPELPGFYTVSMMVHLRNQGGMLGRDTHFVLLRNGRWNQVVWEIPDIARKRVIGLALVYRVQGSEPGAAGTVTFDFDRLELQRVQPDYYEGWSVAPGRIAFSHTGYPAGAGKRAFASGLKADGFDLIDTATGLPVLHGPVENLATSIGEFQILDFTEVSDPGEYCIRAGDVLSRPFRIGDEVWERTIWKAINFFYSERCGMAIPGVHGVCHNDWMGVHGDRKMVINGGWHDAGDLSQGVVNTSEAVYAMFDLAQTLRPEHSALRRALIDEAKWGLDWLLKTRFGDGSRITWATMDFWSNGILGDADDTEFRARNDPFSNFVAAAAQALAARLLRDREPQLSRYCRQSAVDDFQFALAALPEDGPAALALQTAAAGAQTAMDLFYLTGEKKYSDKAIELAATIIRCQQKSVLPGLEVPLTGFFYRDATRERILHYQHRGHEQAPVNALAGLCRAFPDHPDWIKWYAAVALHSEYFQKKMSGLTAPYHMLPNSLYSSEEAAQFSDDAGVQRLCAEQIENGFRVGGKYRVRTFPVQPSHQFRGNYGTLLSQTKALSTAARLRRNAELLYLCYEQLYWVVGRNPFAQSTMYGEGYDYAPQYSAMSGDIVGSLPVGVKSLGNRDLPYWPVTNCWNYKEVWVHPVSRWLWLMRDLAGPAEVSLRNGRGCADSVTFQHLRTGAETKVLTAAARESIPLLLPAGEYLIRIGDVRIRRCFFAGETSELDLRQENLADFSLAAETAAGGRVTLTVEASGRGEHLIEVRGDNIALAQTRRRINLNTSSPVTVTWSGEINIPERPWIVVLIPDRDPSQLREIHGSMNY